MLLLVWVTVGRADPVDEEDQPPRCDHYVERDLGPLSGGRLILIECTSSLYSHGHIELSVEARWEGPPGPVSSPLLTVGDAYLESWTLAADGLSLVIAGTSNPYGGMDGWSFLRSAWDAASHRFAPAVEQSSETFDERQGRKVVDRLARGDRLAAMDLVGAEDPTTGTPSDAAPLRVAVAVRDAALADHAAGRKRDAADRVLALFSRMPTSEYGDSVAIPDVGALSLGIDDPGIEVLNDLGFLLDEGGEAAAAAAVLSKVVAERPTGRPVAMLNYADALWHLGDPAASEWYTMYLAQADKPARWARARVKQPPPRPSLVPNDAEVRYLAALASADLERAAGAAASGRLAPEARTDWWIAGAAEVARRWAGGDPEGVVAVMRYLGQMPAQRLDPALKAALRPTALAVSVVPGTDVRPWIGAPDDPVEAVAIARSGGRGGHGRMIGYGDALKMGETSAVLSLAVIGGEACAELWDGRPPSHWQCPGGERERPTLRYLSAGCTDAQWPCFVVKAATLDFHCPAHVDAELCSATDPPPTAAGHACGTDPLGQLRCVGTDALAKVPPPVGLGFGTVVTADDHACALHPDHHAVCWGDNGRGQAPARIEAVVDLIAGHRWTCTLGLDGKVACLGDAPPLPALPPPPPFLTPFDYAELAR